VFSPVSHQLIGAGKTSGIPGKDGSLPSFAMTKRLFWQRAAVWGAIRRRRRGRQLEIRLVAGESSQEGNNTGVFGTAEFLAELNAAHGVDGFAEGVDGAVVEVGISQFDIAQGGILKLKRSAVR
jgi:hypothetical protein